MADNLYANKVVFNGTTLMDISGDTATAADVARGKTFHDATGAQVTGTAEGGADTSSDTVTAAGLQQGLTAHDASGTLITGTATFVSGNARSILVNAPTGSTVTATKDGNTYTAAESEDEPGTWNIAVPEYGVYTLEATTDGNTASTTVSVAPERAAIDPLGLEYTVEWDGTSTTTLTRKNAAARFTDPVPYVAGASDYGSPFDDIAPWKNIVRVTDAAAGEMVKIPKFWYKLAQVGSQGVEISIANKALTGYSVCPACMDRGDGAGERDYVLVGRYHCAAGNYRSETGVLPQVNLAQATFRQNIHALGDDIYMIDFATRFTIWLLYIVEFANWNSQACIGYGCAPTGSTSTVRNMGYTDSMPYHTGTDQTSRTTYGGTQYRYMEGLWDNCYDRLTGCYNASGGLYITVNPTKFAENSGGTSVGTPANGWIAGLKVSTSGPFPCFINSSTTGGGEAAYVCDSWYFDASNPVVCAGGSYSQSGYHGLFCLNFAALANALANRGSRLLRFP